MIEKETIVQEKLGAVLYDLAELELDALDFTDTFKELGIDSYTTLRLSRALELVFQVNVSYKHLISELINLEGLLDFIVQQAPEQLVTY